MVKNTVIRQALYRISFLAVISLAFVWGISEIAFQFQKTDKDRPPQEVELIIPSGTAAKIAEGEENPSIPTEMSFVIGDILVVKNEDVVDHVLGPLWIPPGASANLKLEQANKFAYSCSFQPTQYFGVDVEKPTTWETRVTAFSLAVPGTVGFLFIYSLILWPIKPRVKKEGDNPKDEEPATEIVGS
jgi:hypothetical protein